MLLPFLPVIVACTPLTSHATSDPEPTSSLSSSVTITFVHFGQAINPLDARMAELSAVHTSSPPGDDVWFKISNQSDRVIEFSTHSVYLRPLVEWDQFPDQTKRLSLKDGAEISVDFRVEDARGRPIPYGLDFHWTSRLKPGHSAFFGVPRAVLAHGRSIYVDYAAEDPSTGENSNDRYRAYFRGKDLPTEAP
jgi:hypothetical protein